MTDQQLAAAFEEQLKNQVYFWTIHGWINLSLVPATALMEFYNDEIQPDDPNEGWQLTQGYRTKSVDASNGLWRLSRTVKASPALSKIFEQVDPAAMLAALEALRRGQGLSGRAARVSRRVRLAQRRHLRDRATRPGARSRRFRSTPSRGTCGWATSDNPELALEQAAKRREGLTRAARAKLAARSGQAASASTTLMEAAKYNTARDRGPQLLDRPDGHRRTCAASASRVGQRLVERGVLDRAGRRVLPVQARAARGAGGPGDWSALVAQRRASMEASARIVPPDHLGAPTPANADPFFIALVDKMLGFLPVEPSTDPSVITGVAASPGTVQGTAKVVRSLLEASKLQQGDIMVCEMTVPTWVPLFATVSAIVADSGGILSHCAIVAREFRLPAVVGTRVGTTVIKDGMTITVDGTQGMVRIDSRK